MPNHLAGEKSPYLLQHAHNPVDWYPWGDLAFEKARAEDKPIFLSIGYSTCHWCHVMERESFESPAVAEALNREFVSIKVDREERPDVDRIYMSFVQATTGSGGWPMSVFLTPNLEPFYGGTYFPPDSRYGRPGFRDLVEFLARKWKSERAKLISAAADTVEQLRQMSGSESGGEAEVNAAALDRTYNYFRRSFDTKLGGFGRAPKFPRPAVHNFLLRYFAVTGNQEAVEIVAFTLAEMAKGGMNDQLGGGFHRYSVDERWFVPHFEKMLYDQAQLAISYLETYQLTGDESLAATARDIFEYVMRDLTHPDGGFYSAEDADSVIDDDPGAKHKGEGAFYIWTDAELRQLLTDDAVASDFIRTYGVLAGGNVDEDPHREFTGKNILYRANNPSNPQAIDAARHLLLEARAKRTRPHLDDKVLTSWNALMISAFALGARVLGGDDPRLLEAAKRAANFVLRHLYQPEQARLLRRYRDGEAAVAGFLDDYAFFAQAMLDLYEASQDTFYFEVAVQLAGAILDRFEDRETGGFFSTEAGDRSLIVRMKDDYDGAEPAGNSYAVLVLARLAHLTGRDHFREAATRALASFSAKLAGQGPALPMMLVAWMTLQAAPRQVVLAGPPGGEMTAMRRIASKHFGPFTSLIVLDDSNPASRERMEAYRPDLAAMQAKGGRPAAYVCENFACQLPVTTAEELSRLLH